MILPYSPRTFSLVVNGSVDNGIDSDSVASSYSGIAGVTCIGPIGIRNTN